ncbi:MAG: hypothetical protein AAGI63_08015 [Planctomycetota bacterium]
MIGERIAIDVQTTFAAAISIFRPENAFERAQSVFVVAVWPFSCFLVLSLAHPNPPDREAKLNTIHHPPSQDDRPDDLLNPSDRLRIEARRRRALTILFAIVLATMASVASAQSGNAIYYSESGSADQSAHVSTLVPPSPCINELVQHRVGVGYLATTPDHVSQIDLPQAIHGASIPLSRHARISRPIYVELAASLSNFDPDAEPDGWRAEIVLRDRNDRPVVMRAYASFELTPRVATLDSRRFINTTEKPIRWSMPLTFDDDGVARLKLPLRDTLKPMLGWSSASYPASGIRSTGNGARSRPTRPRHRRRTFVTSDVRDLIGTPSSGELRVRVSVPTEGVFEAASAVHIRPSVLVDTQWPYR